MQLLKIKPRDQAEWLSWMAGVEILPLIGHFA